MNRERTFLYTLARGIAGILYPLIFRAKARGQEHFPADTNCILLANHISAWDPITVARYYTISEVHFMGKESLFKVKPLAWLLRKLHAFPVNRGESDMAALRQSMQVLGEGHVLGIFPEGHRQQGDRVRFIETGVAVIALRSDVPLVPMLITGKYRLFGRPRLVVGEPIPLDDLRGRRADKETLEALKARIIDALEALRPLSDF